jgi:2-hydroxychromene-2-carboxylate isomerase
MKFDCNLIAKKNNIPFIWNTKFPINSLYLMRGYLAINEELKKKYFDLFFNAYWKNNIDISSQENVNKVLENLGIDKKKYFEKIQNVEIKDELKKLTNIAFEKNIFGAPTFVVNNKIFWGQDRLEYALDEYNS